MVLGRGGCRWLLFGWFFVLGTLALEQPVLAHSAPLATQGCQGTACDTPDLEEVRRGRVKTKRENISEDRGGSPVLAVILGMFTGVGAMCGTQLALGVLSWLPLVGWVVGLAGPCIVGTVGALAAYAVVSKITRRRTPVLPAVGAAVASVCGGTLLNLLFGAAAYGCLGLGYVALLGGDSVGVAVGFCAMGLGGCLGCLGCLSSLGGYGLGGLLSSLVGVTMGRPLGADEQGLYWDMVEVPPGDGGDDDRPRRRSNKAKRQYDHDDEDDDEDDE